MSRISLSRWTFTLIYTIHKCIHWREPIRKAPTSSTWMDKKNRVSFLIQKLHAYTHRNRWQLHWKHLHGVRMLLKRFLSFAYRKYPVAGCKREWKKMKHTTDPTLSNPCKHTSHALTKRKRPRSPGGHTFNTQQIKSRKKNLWRLEIVVLTIFLFYVLCFFATFFFQLAHEVLGFNIKQ